MAGDLTSQRMLAAVSAANVDNPAGADLNSAGATVNAAGAITDEACIVPLSSALFHPHRHDMR